MTQGLKTADLVLTGGKIRTLDPAQPEVSSVAIKDRTSILLGGKKPDHAFWFDNGRLK